MESAEPGHEGKFKGGGPEKQTESDDQPPQPTAALRKLNKTWTESRPTVLSSRTRSGGGAAVTNGHEAALNVVLDSDGELEHETMAHESAANLYPMKVHKRFCVSTASSILLTEPTLTLRIKNTSDPEKVSVLVK